MGTAKPRHPDTRFLSFSLVTAFRYFAPHADNDPSEHLEFEVRLPPHGPGYRFQMYVPDFPLSRVLLRAMVAELPERHGLPPVETVGRPQPTTAQASTAGESRDTQAVPKPATAPPRAQRTSRLGIRRPR